MGNTNNTKELVLNRGPDGKMRAYSVEATPKQLQKKFLKHAKDFGVEGNYNKANLEKFKSKVMEHINSPDVMAIEGTYRNVSVIHYLNPNTGLNVISSNGQFWSGWILGPEKLQGVLTKKTLW